MHKLSLVFCFSHLPQCFLNGCAKSILNVACRYLKPYHNEYYNSKSFVIVLKCSRNRKTHAHKIWLL